MSRAQMGQINFVAGFRCDSRSGLRIPACVELNPERKISMRSLKFDPIFADSRDASRFVLPAMRRCSPEDSQLLPWPHHPPCRRHIRSSFQLANSQRLSSRTNRTPEQDRFWWLFAQEANREPSQRSLHPHHFGTEGRGSILSPSLQRPTQPLPFASGATRAAKT